MRAGAAALFAPRPLADVRHGQLYLGAVHASAPSRAAVTAFYGSHRIGAVHIGLAPGAARAVVIRIPARLRTALRRHAKVPLRVTLAVSDLEGTHRRTRTLTVPVKR